MYNTVNVKFRDAIKLHGAIVQERSPGFGTKGGMDVNDLSVETILACIAG